MLDLIDNQVRSLRKPLVIDAFKAGSRKGAYWGIRMDIADYGIGNTLNYPFDKMIRLANIATHLKQLEPETQEKFIKWGYAVCETAMRKHVDAGLPTPAFGCIV